MRTRSHPGSTPSPRRRRLAVGATVTVSALALGLAVTPAAQAADSVTINLVTVNDFHGRIENEAASGAAGIAALATAVNQVRATNPNTVFAAAGDMIGASTFTSFIQDDEPTIAGLNAAGLDVSSVGNHEFDKGWADLRDRVQPLADWEYLASNLFAKGTTDPILPEYYTETFDGVTIGFVGAVTNELPSLVSPSGIEDVTVGDVTENVNRVADQLSDGNDANGEADIVVLLVHEGAADTSAATAANPATPFGKIVTGANANVDAIVSGHTHLAYNHVINGRPVISSGQYGEKFSNMTIVYDKPTQSFTMNNVTVNMKGAGPAFPPNYADDPTIAETIVKPAKAVAAVKGAVKLGDITAAFNRALQPGLDANGNPVLVENRGGESTLGNWVADVQLWAAQQDKPSTKLAFMNPGGLRANMGYTSTGPTDPDGNVTYKEAADVQPFANTLVTLTLTGDQVRQVLEQQWQPAGAARPFLKLGISQEFTYTFDPTALAGSRITGMFYDGVAVTPTETFDVVVNSFLASGGDNFPAFTLGTGKADSGKVDLESVVQWFPAHPSASPDLAQRAVGIHLSAPASQLGYKAGETVQVDLSSLDFTTTETPAGTVDVAIGGKPVGTAQIDRTPTLANDLAGRATLSVVVPKGVTGTVPLTVTTPSGTVAQTSVTIYEQVPSYTIGIPHTLFAKKGTPVTYSVLVVAGGGAVPTGTVTVLDKGTTIATATLTEANGGLVTLTLPGFSRGVHLLSASFAGSDLVKASTSHRLPLLVW